MIKVYSDYEYRIIHSNEISFMRNPGFPWKGNSEKDFVNFMKQSQQYFKEWEQTKSNASYKVGNVDFAYVYLDIGRCVCVERKKNGKYIVASEGRHRLYVAKKYKFDILVCVVNS